MRSTTEDLISALRILAEDCAGLGGDGNAIVCRFAADRMEEMRAEIANQREIIKHLKEAAHE